MRLEDVLARFERVRRNGAGWQALCPAHEDRHPSLAVDEGEEGRILLRCHAGCSTEAVVAAVGLTMADLFDSERAVPTRRTSRGSLSRKRLLPDAGKLHAALLGNEKALARLEELRGWTRPAIEALGLGFDGKRVTVPYFSATGEYVGLGRYNPNPEHRGDGPKLKADPGSRRELFPRPESLNGDRLFLVEGEPDAVRALSCGLAAVSVPGVQGWRSEWAKRFRDKRVCVCFDSDPPGREAAQRVAADLVESAAEVRLLDLDPDTESGFDLTDFTRPAKAGSERADVRRILERCAKRAPLFGNIDSSPDVPDTRTDGAEPAAENEKVVRKGDLDALGQIPALALESDILGHFQADLRLAGVAGEECLGSLVYLALTSRVLPWGKSTERPVSALTKGTTSTGKSHATQTVLRFFPDAAYISLGSISRRYLFYTEEDFAHRFLVVPEWASIKEDPELVTMLRTLLSEGRVIHGTVEGEGKRSARRIEKEGPTGLLVTTTEGFVDTEMETRCLSLSTDDTPAQTRRVYGVFADLEEEAASPVDFQAWQNLQAWIAEHGEARVFIPFVRALSELMPVGATRLRRDFVSLLCLVRAHAILFQAQREKDARGRIVATVDGDYRPVRALVGELIAEGVEASAPARTRETVEAVRGLIEEGGLHPSPKAISDKLEIGRSATYDRIKDALRRGFLVNGAAKNERGYRLVLGAELPAAGEDFLPSPEAIVRRSSAAQSGQSSGSAIPSEEPLSGRPARPDALWPDVGEDCTLDVDEEEVERLAFEYYERQRSSDPGGAE